MHIGWPYVVPCSQACPPPGCLSPADVLQDEASHSQAVALLEETLHSERRLCHEARLRESQMHSSALADAQRQSREVCIGGTRWA